MLSVQVSPNPALRALLDRHPHVQSIDERPGDDLSWFECGRQRAIRLGDTSLPLRGLVELIDNNPLVCADAFSVPGPAATLACIALGPIIEAGILAERPTMLISGSAEESEITPYLEPLGWSKGLIVAGDIVEIGDAIAATVVSVISTPNDLNELDALYDERYGRCFFVRADQESSWDVQLVLGKPHALYRLRVAPDEPNSLFTIQVMADRQGKCGAAQIVHAFNVMAGFEESTGLE